MRRNGRSCECPLRRGTSGLPELQSSDQWPESTSFAPRKPAIHQPAAGYKRENQTQKGAQSLSLIISEARLINKCREQRLRKRIVFPASLRMPLNTDDEPARRVLYSFHNTVGRISNGTQGPPDVLYRLVMVALHLDVRTARQAADQAAFRDPHHVPGGRPG